MIRKIIYSILLLTALATLPVTTALADGQGVDNDLALSGNQNIVDMGTVSPGTALTTSGQILIRHSGGNHLAAGTSVTFTKIASQTSLPAGYSVTDVTLTVSTPWGDGGEVSGTSTVTFTANATVGAHSDTVKWAPTVDYGNKLTGAPALVINYTVKDITPPVVTPPADVTAEATGLLTPVSIGAATATDAVGVVSLTNNAPALFPLGDTTVTWTAKDAAGNAGVATQKVTVKDTTPPAIAAPAAKVVEGNTTGGASGIALGSPAVADIVDPSPIVTNNAPALFPLGDTTVTWTATDHSGNSASAAQKVTVKDTTPPAIAAPAAKVVEGNTTGGASGIALGSPVVADIVDPSPIVTNNAPALFPLGDTTVTWTATDHSGNSASAAQKVTVKDTTPPAITAVASLTVIVGAPKSVLPAASAVDIVDPGPTLTNNAPSVFPVGTTIVTWTATDHSGNSATARTTVVAIYNFGGFLPPLGPGPRTFNPGSTIPVKFKLTDYNGNPVSTATGTASINTSPAASATVRYDAPQYVANLNTAKGVLPGQYTITVTLNDGVSRTIVVTLGKESESKKESEKDDKSDKNDGSNKNASDKGGNSSKNKD